MHSWRTTRREARDHNPADDAAGVNEETWAILASRPLRLPSQASGELCPVSERTSDPIDPQQTSIVGGGPIYAVFGHLPGDFPGPWRQDGGWYYVKVLFLSRASYQGPALIRLDAEADVRFGDALADPARELRFPAGDTLVRSQHSLNQWRDLPAYVRIGGPGCYAMQVDGPDFSNAITFEVTP